MSKQLFRTNLVPVGKRLSLYDLRNLARSEPGEFIHKINQGVADGKLTLSDIRDWKGLYSMLADVPVQVSMEMAGAQRTIAASAFPIMTGTLAIAAINAAYAGVPSVGEQLVTDFEDNKKVTSIAAIHTLDKAGVDEVKELGEFPEVGVDEEKVEIRHRRNGRRLTISAEAIEENEVADIVSRINALGEIAGEWIEEQTLARVTDHYGSGTTPAEPYVYRPAGTGTQLYNATADNPGTRAPQGTRETNNALVDETDLAAARAVLRAMKNARGKRINIPWSEVYILVPDALESTLMKIVSSELVPGVENEINVWGPRGKYYIPLNRCLSTPKLDDLSTSAWYMGDFKRQFRRKWKLRFEYVTLGQDTQAYLNSRIAFQARLAWDVEVGAVDYVYVVQNLSGTTAPVDE
jgi:hypothetical protein